jgi:hypothetical protein
VVIVLTVAGSSTAVELEFGVAFELVAYPAQHDRIDELVGEHDPPDGERPGQLDLPAGGEPDGPTAGVQGDDRCLQIRQSRRRVEELADRCTLRGRGQALVLRADPHPVRVVDPRSIDQCVGR